MKFFWNTSTSCLISVQMIVGSSQWELIFWFCLSVFNIPAMMVARIKLRWTRFSNILQVSSVFPPPSWRCLPPERVALLLRGADDGFFLGEKRLEHFIAHHHVNGSTPSRQTWTIGIHRLQKTNVGVYGCFYCHPQTFIFVKILCCAWRLTFGSNLSHGSTCIKESYGTISKLGQHQRRSAADGIGVMIPFFFFFLRQLKGPKSKLYHEKNGVKAGMVE